MWDIYVCVYIYTHTYTYAYIWASLVAQTVNNLPAMRETRVRSLSWKDPLEKEMATHFSILAWRISWTEDPGWLQSMGSQRVGHDWVTNIFTYIKWGWSSLKVQVNYHKLVAQNPMVPAPTALHSLPLVILTASWEFPMTSYCRRQIRGIKLLNHWSICMVCHSSWNGTTAALPLRWPWGTVEKKSPLRGQDSGCALYSLLHM